MTGRDRMVLLAVVVVALLGGVYLKVVKPERKKAATLATEVSAANSQLSTTEGQLASARTAQSDYASAYAAVVELGKAVPPQPETASLIFQLGVASHVKNVDFNSISSGTGSSGAGSSSSSAGSSSASSKAAASTGLTPLPFTFGFEGGFHQLASLLETIEGFTKTTPSGALQITGRLLTIESVKLGPASSSSKQVTSSLAGTITASAYQLPVSQEGGATSSSPSSATPASTKSSTPSSPTTPAVAKVTTP